MDYTSGGPVGGLPYRAKFSVPPDMVGLDKIQEPWNNQRLTMNDNRLSIYGGPGATAKFAPSAVGVWGLRLPLAGTLVAPSGLSSR